MKQKQQMRLTPQQMLQLQLLQLPIDTLQQRLQEEIASNPMLEEEEQRVDNEISLTDYIERDNGYEEEEDEDYGYRERMEVDKNHEERERIVVGETTLTALLMEQLALQNLDERQQAIGEEIIGSINDNGYLDRDTQLMMNDLAFRGGIEVSEEEVEEVLRIVQRFDPPGVGARDLQECLILQLERDRSEASKTALEIARQHFALLANHQYEKLREKLGVGEEEIDEALRAIRKLTPKPGMAVSDSRRTAAYIVPDLYVVVQGGELRVIVNDKRIPQLRLSNEYQEMLTAMERGGRTEKERQSEEARRFLKAKQEEATQFIEAMNQRHRTIYTIAKQIVEEQEAYFRTGRREEMRPLLQKEIAEATGYDTSTVSRAVGNKYVETIFGTIALRDCFTTAVAVEDGTVESVEKIKGAIEQMVREEDKERPLTDDEIKQKLEAKGYTVARRTVAKYREALGIAIARLRRGMKLMVLVMLIGCCGAVRGQRPTYYDSIINSLYAKPGGDDKRGERKKMREKTPRPTADKGQADYTIEEDTNQIIHYKDLPMEMLFWYGAHFSPYRVRELDIRPDSLPDEINITLCKNDSGFCFPVKNIITSPYGWREWNHRPHRGVDIRLQTGCPVHAVFGGIVRIARTMGGYGKLVVIRHSNGLETVYGHLSRINVQPQQRVKAGEVIGLGGSTGHSTGPHLHFEVRFVYQAFDPEWILDFSNYTLRTHRLHLDKSYFGISKPRRGEEIAYKADKSYVKEEPIERKKKEPRYYTAQKGDYMELVAMKSGITTEHLKKLNPELKKVKPGMQIRVR